MPSVAPACVAVVVAGLARAAAAAPCPPSATLVGDAPLVAEIGALLGDRGVAVEPPGCPTIQVAVTGRSDQLTLALEHDGRRIERVVGDAATAATVIESFVRVDLARPLLAGRAVFAAAPAPPAPSLVRDDGAGPRPGRLRGVHLFAGLDSAVASDGTRWLGAQLGVCVQLGPVCAAVRHRFGRVAGGTWDRDLGRQAIELLAGIDIPAVLGPVVLSPGFATGIGQIRTRRRSTDMRIETGGLRADVHATLSVAVYRRLTVDVFAAAVLTEATHVEGGSAATEFPDEPRLLGHLGLGLRYGGL